MYDEHIKGLNSSQQQAVQHGEGPLLVLAGAGSGKTRVITHRIAHLITNGKARADRILGVTFTNKAAGEMKERVINLLGDVGKYVWLSTFHSFCARLLRQHAEMLGYKRDFTIYDSADSGALIKRIIKDLGLPENQPSPGQAQNAISKAKDKLISPQEFLESADDYIIQNIALVYQQYQRQLKRNNALDFDDLLFATVVLLEKFPKVTAYYNSKFQYLLVDEYQDTNHTQYRLVKLLAGERKNVCVVGDDDQSIYGWRGADISNILNFESDFPGCKVVKLEQNYRSTDVILEAAYEVIRKNKSRKAKKLFTDQTGGDYITLMMCGDERDESGVIATKIQYALSQDKSPSDFAVMYRTHSQSRSIEDALRDSGIPYIIVGGTRFYERKEIKDVVAYLRLLVNPADTESLVRIINVPRRGVGKVSVDKLLKAANEQNIPAFDLLSQADTVGIKGKTAAELNKLYETLTALSARLDELPPNDLVARLIDKSGYLAMLEKEDTPEADVRIENVKELVNAVIAFMVRIEEEQEEDQNPTLGGFLEEVALISEIDNWNNKDSAVVLMSLHAAKGLEFDTVFLTGMEQGLFPMIRETLLHSPDKEMEEERRLCYVGITRARMKLYLSMAGFRRRFDGGNITSPSSFLNDIPENLLEVEQFNYYNNGAARNVTNSYKSNYSNNYKKKSQAYKEDIYPDYEDESDDILKIGMTVSHNKFGVGKIVDKEGSGEAMMLTIKFGGGTKKIMPKYAAIEVLGT
ncbi:MAG: UvrD-helicase domain-containing protein [candidate division Zixibacteria bacterium]|nr:UvrD-helicase domain-containing protein [candidate division Zixibacteria bacterium]